MQRASISSCWPTGPETFAGFGFDSDLMWVQVEDAGDAVADGVVVVGEFGLFGVDYAVEVDDVIARFIYSRCGGAEHIGGIAATICGIGVGEQTADIW